MGTNRDVARPLRIVGIVLLRIGGSNFASLQFLLILARITKEMGGGMIRIPQSALGYARDNKIQ